MNDGKAILEEGMKEMIFQLLIDAKAVADTYGVTIAEALEILTFLEVKKVHYHCDMTLTGAQK